MLSINLLIPWTSYGKSKSPENRELLCNECDIMLTLNAGRVNINNF